MMKCNITEFFASIWMNSILLDLNEQIIPSQSKKMI